MTNWTDIPAPVAETESTTVRLLNQLAKGAIGAWMWSPEARRQETALGGAFGYLPNAVWQLGSMMEAGAELAGVPTSDVARRYAGSTNEYLNQALGTTDPQSTSDVAMEVVGSMAMPGGALPKTIKGIAAILPFRQAKTLPGTALEATAGTAIGDVLSETLDPAYQSVTGIDLSGATALSPGTPGQQPIPEQPTPVAAPTAPATNWTDIETPALDAPAPITPVGSTGQWHDLEISDDWTPLQRATGIGLLIAGGSAGLSFGSRYARKLITKRPAPGAEAREARLGPDALAGTDVRPGFKEPTTRETIETLDAGMLRRAGQRIAAGDVRGVAGEVSQAVMDRNAPIYYNANKAMPPDEAYQLYSDLTTNVTPHAMSTKIKAAVDQGKLPFTDIEFATPLKRTLNAYAQLTPDEARLVDNALLAGTKLDDMLNPRAKKPPVVWGAQTIGDLTNKYTAVAGNPKLNQIVDEVREVYRTLRKYQTEHGIKDVQEYLREIVENPDYVPLEVNAGIARLSHKRERAGTTGVRVGEARPPLDSVVREIEATIRDVVQNNIRLRFIDAMSGANMKATIGPQAKRRLVEKVSADDNAGNVIKVYRAGRVEKWRINDPATYSALRFHPSTAVRYLSTARAATQWVTTGPGNPWFKPLTYQYDVIASLVGNYRGRGLGVLDEILTHLSRGKLNLRGWDPTVAVSIVPSAMRTVWAETVRSVGEAMDASIRSNGRLNKLLGTTTLTQLRDVMQAAYNNSTKGLMERFGAESIVSWRDLSDATPTDLAIFAPKYANKYGTVSMRMRAHGLNRMYHGVLNIFNEAVRMQAFAANVPRQVGTGYVRMGGRNVPYFTFRPRGFDPNAMSTLANDIRRLTGDPSQRVGDVMTVGGKTISGITESAPYANVAIQEMAQLARALHHNPTRTITMLSTLGFGGLALVSAMLEDDRVLDHYVNELTPQQRAQKLPIYDPETGEVQQVFGITGGLRPYWSMLVEGYLALIGATKDNPLKAAFEAAFDSMTRDLLPIPRVVSDVGGLTDLGQSRTDPGNDPTYIDYAMNAIELVVGTAATAAIQGAQAMINGIAGGEALTDIAGRTMEPYVHRGYEPGYGGSILFPHQAKEFKTGLNDPISNDFNDGMRAVRGVTDKYNSQRNPNYGRVTGAPGTEGQLFTEQQPATPEEAIIGEGARMVNSIMEQIGLTAQIAGARRRLEAIDKDIGVDSLTRRKMENDIRRDMRDLYAQGLDVIEDVEADISNRLGTPFKFIDATP